MKYILVVLAPDNKTGFANQMFIMAHSISWAIENSVNIVFFTKFLNQINTNSCSNISDIVDIKQTNDFLSKYNVQIADYNNFDFKLNGINYGIDNLNIDIFNEFKYFINGNGITIPNSYSFSNLNSKLANIITNYGINLTSNIPKLKLEYSLDDKVNTISYNLVNDKLDNDINIDFTNIQSYMFSVKCYTPLFYEIRTNIVFRHYFIDSVTKYFKDNNIYTNRNINCIHLRLESDALTQWAEIINTTEENLKIILEQKYIIQILENIKKDDLTIILSSDYDNNVIKFLQNNNYNFITTPMWSEFRDISAIYDLHITNYCNNIFIGIFESSFSYLILFRIKPHIRQYIEIKAIED